MLIMELLNGLFWLYYFLKERNKEREKGEKYKAYCTKQILR
jgi:hypothetical protein